MSMTGVRLTDTLKATNYLLCRALRDRIKCRLQISTQCRGNQRRVFLTMVKGLPSL